MQATAAPGTTGGADCGWLPLPRGRNAGPSVSEAERFSGERKGRVRKETEREEGRPPRSDSGEDVPPGGVISRVRSRHQDGWNRHPGDPLGRRFAESPPVGREAAWRRRRKRLLGVRPGRTPDPGRTRRRPAVRALGSDGARREQRQAGGNRWGRGGAFVGRQGEQAGSERTAARGVRPGKVTLTGAAEGGRGARLVAGAQQALTWDRPAWREETSRAGEG